MEIKKECVKALSNEIHSLKEIHLSVTKIQHGINTENKGWIDYFPSQFVYSFFTFNTLYNINWRESLRYGIWQSYIKTQEPNSKSCRIYEETKQKYYTNVCLGKNNEFAEFFRPLFFKIVYHGYSPELIRTVLKGVKIDQSDNGRIDENKKTSFIMQFEELYLPTGFTQEAIYNVIHFLYLVRCNLFHGTKDWKEIQNLSQQIRFRIYANIMTAINQMVFSMIDFSTNKAQLLRDPSIYYDRVIRELFG